MQQSPAIAEKLARTPANITLFLYASRNAGLTALRWDVRYQV